MLNFSLLYSNPTAGFAHSINFHDWNVETEEEFECFPHDRSSTADEQTATIETQSQPHFLKHQLVSHGKTARPRATGIYKKYEMHALQTENIDTIKFTCSCNFKIKTHSQMYSPVLFLTRLRRPCCRWVQYLAPRILGASSSSRYLSQLRSSLPASFPRLVELRETRSVELLSMLRLMSPLKSKFVHVTSLTWSILSCEVVSLLKNGHSNHDQTACPKNYCMWLESSYNLKYISMCSWYYLMARPSR